MAYCIGIGTLQLMHSVTEPKEANIEVRLRANRKQHKTFCGLLPESRGQDLVSTVIRVPYSLDRGRNGCPLPRPSEKHTALDV